MHTGMQLATCKFLHFNGRAKNGKDRPVLVAKVGLGDQFGGGLIFPLQLVSSVHSTKKVHSVIGIDNYEIFIYSILSVLEALKIILH